MGSHFNLDCHKKSDSNLNHFLLSNIWDILVGIDFRNPIEFDNEWIKLVLISLKVCNRENLQVYKKDIKIVNEFLEKTKIMSIKKRSEYEISNK